MNKGKLIVIVAPSGTGKSTLIERLSKDFPHIKWSVSCTTRPIRTGEVHNVNYCFISKDEFEAKIKEDAFIEWAQVHSNYYGTLKSFVTEGLNRGEFLLFDIDVQGADNIKKHFGKDADVIFIEPPSVEELEKRLYKRATDAKEVIELRVANAKKELLRKNDFDYLVLNDDVDRAYQKLKQIVTDIVGKH